MSGLLGANEMKQLNSFEYNGFLSNGNACIDTSIELKQPSVSFSFQKDAVNWLQQIITKCKREKIELLITFSPEYRYVSQQSVENFPFFFKNYLIAWPLLMDCLFTGTIAWNYAGTPAILQIQRI